MRSVGDRWEEVRDTRGVSGETDGSKGFGGRVVRSVGVGDFARARISACEVGRISQMGSGQVYETLLLSQFSATATWFR